MEQVFTESESEHWKYLLDDNYTLHYSKKRIDVSTYIDKSYILYSEIKKMAYDLHILNSSKLIQLSEYYYMYFKTLHREFTVSEYDAESLIKPRIKELTEIKEKLSVLHEKIFPEKHGPFANTKYVVDEGR